MADAPTESFDILLDEGVVASDVTLRAHDSLGNVVTTAANGKGTTPGNARAQRR
jgi:hypothetical protein